MACQAVAPRHMDLIILFGCIEVSHCVHEKICLVDVKKGQVNKLFI